MAGLNAALRTIIIDAPINHGNSGGPVVQLAGNKLRIIGIATQYVPVPEDVVPLRPRDVPRLRSRPGHRAGQLRLRRRRVCRFDHRPHLHVPDHRVGPPGRTAQVTS